MVETVKQGGDEDGAQDFPTAPGGEQDGTPVCPHVNVLLYVCQGHPQHSQTQRLEHGNIPTVYMAQRPSRERFY